MTSPGNVLAVDPGARGCGVAYFHAGELSWAELARSPVAEARDASAWVAMASSVLSLFRWPGGYRIDLDDGNFDFVTVVECPQVYERGKGDQNDLILLAAVAGAVAARVAGAEVSSVTPAEWKGQVPKPKRRSEEYIIAKRCASRLKTHELARVILPTDVREQWDVWDAVGIGLHRLRRWFR